MDTSVAIRRAVESDAEGLLALRQTLFAETDFMLWEPSEFRDTAADERRRIQRFNSSPNCLSLVATDQGSLIGFLNAMGGQVNRLAHSTTLALGVLRSHWHQGVGSALLTEALSWSRSAGIARVELTVHTVNERAVSLYKRAGFQVEGTRRKSLFVNGRFVDEFLMSVINAA